MLRERSIATTWACMNRRSFLNRVSRPSSTSSMTSAHFVSPAPCGRPHGAGETKWAEVIDEVEDGRLTLLRKERRFIQAQVVAIERSRSIEVGRFTARAT